MRDGTERSFGLPPFLRRITTIGAILAILSLTLFVNASDTTIFLDQALDWPLFNGSDSFAHAHRIRTLIENSMTPVFLDHHYGHPHGEMLEWPMGFSFLVAAAMYLPARFLGGLGGISPTLLFVQVLFAMLVVWLAFHLARRTLGLGTAFLFGACLALSGAFRTVSGMGGLDHHITEALTVVLLLLVPWCLGSHLGSAGMGAALAACSWCSTLSAYLVAGYFFLMFLFHGGPAVDIDMRKLRTLALGLLFPLVSISLWESTHRGDFGSIQTLSLVQPGLCALGILLWALRLVGKTKLATILASCVVIAALLGAGHKLLWIADFFWAKGGVFEHLGEMRPLLLDAGGPTWTHVHSQFGLLYVACPLMFIWLRRMGAQAQFRCGAWFFLALFILSFAQQRFTHLFAPAFVLAPFVLVAHKVTGRRSRMACHAAIALLLAEPFAVGMASSQPMRPSAATEQARQVALSLNKADPEGQGAVFAPPNLGNALVWLTRRPVVTNTFFYPRKFTFDWDVRQARSLKALKKLLQQRQIVFFIAADDARFRVMLAKLLGFREEARAWSSVQYAPCHHRLLEFAYDRLACAAEESEAFRLIADLHFPGTSLSLLRRLRVFQLNPHDTDIIPTGPHPPAGCPGALIPQPLLPGQPPEPSSPSPFSRGRVL